MFASFTPLTRRIISVGLLLLGLLLIITAIVEPLAGLAVQSVEQLADARFERNRLQQIASAPAPDSAALQRRKQALLTMAITAGDEAQARAALQSQISSLLSQGKLTVLNSRRAPVGDDETLSLVAVHVEARGSERAWLDTFEAIEAARPLLLVRRLDIEAPESDAPDRQLQGQFTIAAVWTQPQGGQQ